MNGWMDGWTLYIYICSKYSVYIDMIQRIGSREIRRLGD